MMKYLWTLLAITLGTTLVWAASKSKPEMKAEEFIFQKVSPHLKVDAQMETLESRYGKRLVLSLTAQRDYDNLKYKVQFYPAIDLLESSPLEGQASLVESETLVLKFTFDVRDVTGVVEAHVTAYEEMSDRKRHGITEMFEVYRPAGVLTNDGTGEIRFSPEKAKRIFQ